MPQTGHVPGLSDPLPSQCIGHTYSEVYSLVFGCFSFLLPVQEKVIKNKRDNAPSLATFAVLYMIKYVDYKLVKNRL